MNLRFKFVSIFVALVIGVFFLAPQADASKPIAKLTEFKGEVIILSGKEFIKTKIGQNLNEGDRIQTKQGTAQITFNDGAVMKIRPFGSAMIQEREEKSGWWIFKTKKTVRRITLYVGKLWFKSGVSKRRNYLQTPTAVCGLRGSVTEWGFNLVNNYLNQTVGTSKIDGAVIRGAFKNFGKATAEKSNVYKKVKSAKEASDAAAADPANAQAQAQADVAKLDAIKETLVTLQGNENLPQEVLDALQKAIDQVTIDLNEALKKKPEPPPPTEGPPPTTSPTPTTSPVTPTVPETTTTVPVTTTAYRRAESLSWESIARLTLEAYRH